VVDIAVAVAAKLRKRLPRLQGSLLAEASMTIGAHVGPGALSITVSPVP
jgi:fatty acid-binding protein DegV